MQYDSFELCLINNGNLFSIFPKFWANIKESLSQTDNY